MDDVSRKEFLNDVILTKINGPKRLASEHANTDGCVDRDSLIPYRSGPHLLKDGKLYRAYRLFDDVNGAFMMAIKPGLKPG